MSLVLSKSCNYMNANYRIINKLMRVAYAYVLGNPRNHAISDLCILINKIQ